jgi:hypothetical protein
MKFSRLTVLFFFAISGFFWLATSVFAQKQNLVAMTNNSTEAAPRRFKAKRLLNSPYWLTREVGRAMMTQEVQEPAEIKNVPTAEDVAEPTATGETEANRDYAIKEVMEVRPKRDFKKEFSFVEPKFEEKRPRFFNGLTVGMLTEEQLARLKFIEQTNPTKAARKRSKMIQNAYLNAWKNPTVYLARYRLYPPNMLNNWIKKASFVESSTTECKVGIDSVDIGPKTLRGFLLRCRSTIKLKPIKIGRLEM